MSWCSGRGFVDGSVVNEGKLLLYLKEVVVPRGAGKRQAGVALPLSTDGLEGYVKAVVDLYATQGTLQLNSHPHPRDQALKNYLSTQKRQRSKRKRMEYHDREEGTIQDTYDVQELKRIVNYFLQQSSGRALRDRLDTLMGHALMARGETTRMMQLPDLFSMELKIEDRTQCTATMVIMDQGKMNQNGRIQYSGCIRHRVVEQCPVGALALYLFWRFQINGEPFPDMTERVKWYDAFVIDGKDSNKQITYGTQARGLKKPMEACKVVSKKVTHIRRTSSCVIAEANGASDASIRRGGRWNNEKMEGCYLTTLPKEVVGALADFNVSGGAFFLPRAECTVPDELSAQVFPAIESTQDKIEDRKIHDIAGQGFLRLLTYLRLVLLQDSAPLMHAFPDHPVWKHPLFSTDIYRCYAAAAEARMSAQDPNVVPPTVHAAIPLLSNIAQSGFSSVGLRLGVIEEVLTVVRGEVEKVLTGNFTVSFASGSAETSDSGPPPADTTVNCDDPPVYCLSRGLRTISEVWQEYEKGVRRPAVRELERVCGARWRKVEAERQYFCRRKVLYEANETLPVSTGLPAASIAERLERVRVMENFTLDKFTREVKRRGPAAMYGA